MALLCGGSFDWSEVTEQRMHCTAHGFFAGMDVKCALINLMTLLRLCIALHSRGRGSARIMLRFKGAEYTATIERPTKHMTLPPATRTR
jgi:hypothetical protein